MWNDPANELGDAAGPAPRTTLRWKSDHRVTKIARRSQTAKRALPKALRDARYAQSVRHKAGRSLPGLQQACRSPLRCAKQYRCRVVRARSCPGRHPFGQALRVHRAVGESDQAPALPFKRSAAYRYVPRSHAPSACRGRPRSRRCQQPATDRPGVVQVPLDRREVSTPARAVTGLDQVPAASRMQAPARQLSADAQPATRILLRLAAARRPSLTRLNSRRGQAQHHDRAGGR